MDLFQHMDTEEEAKAAIAALDGYSVRGSHIHVEVVFFRVTFVGLPLSELLRRVRIHSSGPRDVMDSHEG